MPCSLVNRLIILCFLTYSSLISKQKDQLKGTFEDLLNELVENIVKATEGYVIIFFNSSQFISICHLLRISIPEQIVQL